MKTVTVRSLLLALAAILLGAGPVMAQMMSLSVSSTTLIEGGATAQITATLTGANTETVTLTMSVADSTLEPGDISFQNTLRNFVFPAGTGTRTQSFAIWANDDPDTDNETFTIRSTVTPTTVTPPSPITMMVDDDEPPATELELVVTPNPVDEGNMATVTARRTRGTPQKGIITITVSTAAGTAEAGDWDQNGTTLTLAPGADTSTGLVTITANSEVDEDNETVTVSGTARSSDATDIIRAGHPANVLLTIHDHTGRAPHVAAPGAPTNVRAVPGNGEVTLSWTAPTGTITRWEYEQNGTWTMIPGSGANTVTHKVTGLTNGTEYTFRVRAVNATGNGAPSDAVQATPSVLPGAPTNLRAVAGDGQVTLSWLAPGQTITGWQYEQNGTWNPIPGSRSDTTSHVVTGLTNSTRYTFRVRALNGAGIGPPSNSQVVTPEAGLTPVPALPLPALGLLAAGLLAAGARALRRRWDH